MCTTSMMRRRMTTASSSHCRSRDTFLFVFSSWLLPTTATLLLLLFVFSTRTQQVHAQEQQHHNPQQRRRLIQKDGFRRVAIEGVSEPCFQSVHRLRRRQLLLQQEQQEQQSDDSRHHQEERLLHAASCMEEVKAEQAQISTALMQAIPEASIVDARQRLVNVQFALIPNKVTNAQLEKILLDNSSGASVVSGQEEDEKETSSNNNNNDNKHNNNNVHRVLSSHDFPVVHGKLAQEETQQPTTNNSTTEEATVPSIFTVAEYLGATEQLSKQKCLDGRGIVVAILDSGIDYTHQVFGGIGTVEAYQEAWGAIENGEDDEALLVVTPIQAAENAQKKQQRDGLFPTQVIMEGYDFLGDEGNLTVASPDEDPMDGPEGHGTMVASAIVATAPAAKLLAVKVCNDVQCPDFSVISGLEYALDPNGNGDTEDAADVANLSIAYMYTDVYFAITAKAMEDAYSMGLLIVTVSGNDGNVPYILGYIGGAPNAITVGSTGTPETSEQGSMAEYSSRGPGSVGAQQADLPLKPDVSAPGGYYLLASAGSGVSGQLSRGTSFSAPFVAAGAALLLQQCGRQRTDLVNNNTTTTTAPLADYDILSRPCSPFSIKAILMNTAIRSIRYHGPSEDGTIDETLAPISWVGAGEMNLTRALDTNVWAYSVDDLQPYLSLGLVNVVADSTVRKTIRVLNIPHQTMGAQTLSVTYQFRDAADEAMGALMVDIVSPTITLGSGGGGGNTAENGNAMGETTVLIDFRIIADKVPTNHMTSTGQAGYTVTPLDKNEFDGWIIITNAETGQDISLPFHSILRKASAVTVGKNILPPLDGGSEQPVSVEVNLVNQGAGMAQVDCFELIQTSPDDAETDRGSDIPSADLEYVGYRAFEVNEPDCEYLIEFVAHLWEGKRIFTNTEFRVLFDVDLDLTADLMLANRAPHYHDSLYNMCRVMNATTNDWACTNFVPDHATNSPNLVVRACSNQLKINDVTREFYASFGTLTVPGGTEGPADFTGDPNLLKVPMGISTPSFNIGPGETLTNLALWGDAALHSNLGLVCITDAYRSEFSTGAATKGTEAFTLVFDQVTLPAEITPDLVSFPVATDFRGPGDNWKNSITCPSSSGTGRFLQKLEKVAVPVRYPEDYRRRRVQDEENGDYCAEKPFFRPLQDTITGSPTPAPTITRAPAAPATPKPTSSPTAIAAGPTGSPKGSPGVTTPVSPPQTPANQETVNLASFSIIFGASETIPAVALKDLMEGYLFDQLSGRGLPRLITISLDSVETTDVLDDASQRRRRRRRRRLQTTTEQSTFTVRFSDGSAAFSPPAPAADVVLSNQAAALNDEAALQFAMARHPYIGTTHAQLQFVVLEDGSSTTTSSAAAVVPCGGGDTRIALIWVTIMAAAVFVLGF